MKVCPKIAMRFVLAAIFAIAVLSLFASETQAQGQSCTLVGYPFCWNFPNPWTAVFPKIGLDYEGANSIKATAGPDNRAYRYVLASDGYKIKWSCNGLTYSGGAFTCTSGACDGTPLSAIATEGITSSGVHTITAAPGSQITAPNFKCLVSGACQSGGTGCWSWAGIQERQLDVYMLSCGADSDCAQGQFCDRTSTSPAQWSCKTKPQPPPAQQPPQQTQEQPPRSPPLQQAQASNIPHVSMVDASGSEGVLSMADSNTAYIAYSIDQGNNKKNIKAAKTVDGGLTWSATNNGNPIETLDASAISIYAQDANTVYVSYVTEGNRLKVAKTADGGTSWSIVNGGNAIDSEIINPGYRCGSSIAGTSIGATGSTLYVAYDASIGCIFGSGPTFKVAKSTDGGSSWTITNGGRAIQEFGAFGRGVRPSIVVIDANKVLIADTYTHGNAGNPAGYLRFSSTTDGGSSWTTRIVDVTTSTYGGHVLSPTISMASGTIYTASILANNPSFIVVDPYLLRVSKSTDGGRGWSLQTIDKITLYETQGLPTAALVADDANFLYLAYQSGDGLTVLRTTNGGTSWMPLAVVDVASNGDSPISAGKKGSVILVAYNANPLKVARLVV